MNDRPKRNTPAGEAPQGANFWTLCPEVTSGQLVPKLWGACQRRNTGHRQAHLQGARQAREPDHPRGRPQGPRHALCHRPDEDPQRAGLAAGDEVRRRHQEDHRLVSDAPRVVGDDYLRRVSELLRENVRQSRIRSVEYEDSGNWCGRAARPRCDE